MRTFCFLTLAVMALAGCHSKTTVTGDSAAASVSLFKLGKGVLLSEETRKLFGVEVEEVAEQAMELRVQKTAQIYQTGVGGEPSRALLLLNGEETAGVREGQVMRLKCGGSEDGELAARLVRVDRGTTALGRVEGLIEFTEPEPPRRVGDFVSVTFVTGEARRGLVIPASAVLLTAEGAFVYVVNGTHLTRTKIKIGASADGTVEVREGLYAGDSVAIKGVESLWLVELSALKGGTPCCPAPKKT